MVVRRDAQPDAGNPMTAIEELFDSLQEAGEDIDDAYSGRSKVAATRARKALMSVKEAAHEARKELLAIRKGEKEPVELDHPLLKSGRLDDEE